MSQSPELLKHLIDGEWVEGAGPAARSTDPADPEGAPIAEYATATEQQLDAAFGASQLPESVENVPALSEYIVRARKTLGV